jgi:hypothetical protein
MFDWTQHITFVETPEKLYQEIKARLMSECSVVERMTSEAYAEWVDKMVVKK